MTINDYKEVAKKLQFVLDSKNVTLTKEMVQQLQRFVDKYTARNTLHK